MDFEKKYKELSEKEYTAEDILKILCSLTYRTMKEARTDSADITKTFFGSGFEFIVNIKAKKNNAN